MTNLILWLIIGSIIIGPLIYSAGTIRKMFLGWRVPITWISALPGHGWVQVNGKVRGDPIKSLFSKSDCAYWQLEVQQYQSSGRGGGRWRTVHKQSAGSIEIDDMTGRIKVKDQNSDLVLNNESVVDKLDDGTKMLLENLGVRTKGFLGFNPRLRVYERLLELQEEILVLGKLEKSESAISISAGAIVPLIISNLSKPEMIKTMFWRSVRSMIVPYLFGFAFLAYFIYISTR
jgi:hypothetical protein